METTSCKKVAKKYVCNLCEYNTCRKSSYDKHLSTSKHLNIEFGDNGDDKVAKKLQNYHKCNTCNKCYGSRNGLWKHKKTCSLIENHNCQNNVMNVMLEVVKQNDEFKTLLLDQNNKMLETFQEVCKNGITNNSNNSAVNSHNKTFNIWFDFLLL